MINSTWKMQWGSILTVIMWLITCWWIWNIIISTNDQYCLLRQARCGVFCCFFSHCLERQCAPPPPRSPLFPNNLFCSASCIHWQMFPALGIYRVKGNRCKSLKMPPARSSIYTEKRRERAGVGGVGGQSQQWKHLSPLHNRNICDFHFHF